MSERYFALLVHGNSEMFDSLKVVLHCLGVETSSVATCGEAKQIVSTCKPHVIFAGLSLADGSWLKILNCADELDIPPSVVVVAPQPDTGLYVSVMQRGAFDFIVPPFERESLDFVLRSAVFDTLRRRDEAVRPANVLQEFAPGREPYPTGTAPDSHLSPRGIPRIPTAEESLKAKA